MSDQESNRIRQILGWGMVGLIAVIGVSIVLSLYFVPRPPGAFYHPFFPFHFGWLGGIFLIFIVIWVARWLFWSRRGYYSYQHRQRDDSASIVRERYAKGEITKEQFEQIMRDLRQEG
jgi:putative membrane protein